MIDQVFFNKNLSIIYEISTRLQLYNIYILQKDKIAFIELRLLSILNIQMMTLISCYKIESLVMSYLLVKESKLKFTLFKKIVIFKLSNLIVNYALLRNVGNLYN